ncbi:MAG: hypothetical protein IT210_26585 [Armatimonadetes bacterium]|nr:hypothetical protein [Armatimonadota bacterium]
MRFRIRSRHGLLTSWALLFILITSLSGIAQEKPPQVKRDPARQRRIQRSNSTANEAATLILTLLDRYARNVRNKTDLDRQLEKRLAGNPRSRSIAKRMVSASRRISGERQRAVRSLDQEADSDRFEERYRLAFQKLRQDYPSSKLAGSREMRDKRSGLTRKHSRSESPADELDADKGGPERRSPVKEKSRRNERPERSLFPADLFSSPIRLAGQGASLYQLYFNGMWCHYETDEDHLTDSDEIYIIVSVLDEYGNSVTRRYPQRHDPPYYWDVDTGEYRPKSGSIALAWGGVNGLAARDLIVTIWVWEQDSGNAEEIEEATDLAWKVALTICGATIEDAGPVPCVLSIIAAGVIDAVVAIATGGEDDLVGDAKTVEVSADQMENWVNGGMRTFRREDLSCHFRTIHNGSGRTEGADYHVYFAFHSPLALE